MSPLVQKVIFDTSNPLSSFRYAIGGEFQYLGKILAKNSADKMAFFLGCATLDYLSAQSEKSDQYENVMRLGSFPNYVKSEELAKGGTFIVKIKKYLKMKI